MDASEISKSDYIMERKWNKQEDIEARFLEGVLSALFRGDQIV